MDAIRERLKVVQLGLMRAIGLVRLRDALDGRADARHAAATGRLEGLERSLGEIRGIVADLAGQEGGRARAAHERGTALDAEVRAIRTALAELAAPPPPAPTAEADPGNGPLPRAWIEAVRPYFVRRAWARTTDDDVVVMLVISALRVDPRVERAARALARAGWRVEVVAPDMSTPPAREVPLDWGPGVRFHLLPFDVSNDVMRAPWMVSTALFNAAMNFRPFAFHCHDLMTALVGLRAARRTGARCVCDFHEWHSENVTWSDAAAGWEAHPPQKQRLFRWAERHALLFADRVITVSQAIAGELDALGRKPAGTVRVVRNIPPLSAEPTRSYPPLKEQLGLAPDSFVVLYQGGTGPSRMLDPVIRALALAPAVTLVIRGPWLDAYGPHYRAVAREAGVEGRLVLADPVPSRDVVAAARGADAGLWTLPNISRNFYLALPNKIFEYLASGLPLLVADFPEARHIARNLGTGLTFDPYDPASIAAQMERLAADPGLTASLRGEVPAALATLDAGREWDRLADLYAEMRAASPRAPAAYTPGALSPMRQS